MWDQDIPDEPWVTGILKAVGSDHDKFPPDSSPLHCLSCRCSAAAGRSGNPNLPLEELAAAPFPKLVVTGGHSAGFDAICDDLAQRIGACRAVAAGAGHEIQFAGTPINDTLLAHWRTSR
jgi:hypothetical protein